MVSKEQRNEIITKLIEDNCKTSLSKTVDGDEIYGFYLEPKHRNTDPVAIANMKQIPRLFGNLIGKASSMYGKTNESDWMNQWCECLMYLYEGLEKVFSGEVQIENYSVDTVEDIWDMINDEKKASHLCMFVITFVDRKIKTLIKSKANPDYYYDSQKKKNMPVDYFYLDDTDEHGTSNYEIIADEEYEDECDTGELTTYVLENYLPGLTKKQQLFVQCYLWFGKEKDGFIRDEKGRILYIPQEFQNYKKAIGKRLMKLMENDPVLIENEHGRLTFNWRGEKQ